MKSNSNKTILVTGGTGFIGRWLVPALLNQGYKVIVAMRHAEQRQIEYWQSLAERVNDPTSLQNAVLAVEFDLQNPMQLKSRLPNAHQEIHGIFHLAANFSWGLNPQGAQQINVDASLQLLQWAAEFENLQRFVWIGGYRSGSESITDARDEAAIYRKLGAYEASKLIAQQRLIDAATEWQVPWTALNPATVIGDSQTGDTAQFVGLAEVVEQLFMQRLTAIPGTRQSFVPLVHVDFVADFAARLFDHAESINQEYWLLDDNTPLFPALIQQIADHLGVKAPTTLIPVKWLKLIPQTFVPGSKETLDFICEDHYPTKPANELAQKMGIAARLPIQNLEKWLDSLVAQQFGKATTSDAAKKGYSQQVWSRQFARHTDESVVMLHGMPLDGAAWLALSEQLGINTVVPDLPGFGRSGGQLNQDLSWLDTLVPENGILIGHSLGAGVALRYAHYYPQKVNRLILVSPYFLQSKPSLLLRSKTAGKLLSPFMSKSGLAQQLHPEGRANHAVESAMLALERPLVKENLFHHLAACSSDSHRQEMVELLESCPVPVDLIVGTGDPLSEAVGKGVKVHEIAEAGHNPHLTHTNEMAALCQDIIYRSAA